MRDPNVIRLPLRSDLATADMTAATRAREDPRAFAFVSCNSSATTRRTCESGRSNWIPFGDFRHSRRVNRWFAITLILCRAGSPARLALHPQRTRADRSHIHMAARRPACRREIQSRDVARRRDRGGRFGLSAAFNGATVSAFVFLATINSRRHTPHRYTTPGGSPLKAC